MIQSLLFILCLAVFTAVYLYWGFTRLTSDNRQIFAAMPLGGIGPDTFTGLNLTWYGLLSANALLVAVLLYLVLAAASGISVMAALSLVALLLAILLPSARWIAAIVEKKKHTFTIGGSVFAGILISPWAILVVNHTIGPTVNVRFPMLETLAAFAIAYTLGESVGRLSCISFGCCYGKALKDTHPLFQKLFENHSFVYRGTTRKACYASGFEGVKLLPIQAITAIVYAVTAMIGLILFASGYARAALITCLAMTQIWRSFSEIFRADYRGNGKFSAYQIMGLVAVVYILVMTRFFSQSTAALPNLFQGLSQLWTPGVLLSAQILWLIVFIYMGRSTVTGSTLHVHVVTDHI
jgi:hypothetical protein